MQLIHSKNCVLIFLAPKQKMHISFLIKWLIIKVSERTQKSDLPGLLGPPPPDVCSFRMNLHSLRGAFRAPHLLDWPAYERDMEGQERERPNSKPKAGVLCSSLGGWAASSQSSPLLLSPSSHLSWANIISMLLFLIYLFPTPTHMFFYLGRRAILKKISDIFTPKYLIHISKKRFFQHNCLGIWP